MCSFFSHDSLTPRAKPVIETPSIWKDMVNFKRSKFEFEFELYKQLDVIIFAIFFEGMRLYMCVCMRCWVKFTVKVTGRHIETFTFHVFYYIYFLVIMVGITASRIIII